MNNKDYVRLTIGMPTDFKRQLRRQAAFCDMTMSEFVLAILATHLKREIIKK
jgi:hypothetical protein